MLGFLVLLLVVWVAFIVIGAVIKGLFWLAVIGLILFLVTAAMGWLRRRTCRPPRAVSRAQPRAVKRAKPHEWGVRCGGASSPWRR